MALPAGVVVSMPWVLDARGADGRLLAWLPRGKWFKARGSWNKPTFTP
jgi:hypothetical protein